MKKIFILIVAATTLLSCTQDLHENAPAFQAIHENTLWKAGDASAQLDGTGGLILTAYHDYETIVFYLSSTDAGTYVLGDNTQSNYAVYTYEGDGVSESYDTDIYAGPAYTIDQIVTAGSNYSLNDIVLTQFSTISPDNGSGLRLYINSVDTDGGVTDVAIVSRGNGYYPGDVVTLVEGDENATVEILNTQYSNGEITLEQSSNGTYSGTFKFTATDGNENTASFADGVFYNVPIR